MPNPHSKKEILNSFAKTMARRILASLAVTALLYHLLFSLINNFLMDERLTATRGSLLNIHQIMDRFDDDLEAQGSNTSISDWCQLDGAVDEGCLQIMLHLNESYNSEKMNSAMEKLKNTDNKGVRVHWFYPHPFVSQHLKKEINIQLEAWGAISGHEHADNAGKLYRKTAIDYFSYYYVLLLFLAMTFVIINVRSVTSTCTQALRFKWTDRSPALHFIANMLKNKKSTLPKDELQFYSDLENSKFPSNRYAFLWSVTHPVFNKRFYKEIALSIALGLILIAIQGGILHLY